jgi:hypothetical protein
VSHWPEKSMNRSLNNEANWKIAQNYRLTEGFMDLQQPIYGKTLTFQQVCSCLLARVPVVTDYNHWSHSVLGMDVVSATDKYPVDDPRSYGLRIWNSWTDRFGRLGTGILLGYKAVPDGAIAIRSVTYSDGE